MCQINGGPQYYHNTCRTHPESFRDYNGEEEEDGLVTRSGDYSYMPEMRDNECQTRESLFHNRCSLSITTPTTEENTANKIINTSPSPPPPCTIKRNNIKPVNALPPVTTPQIGFTTFGYKNNQKPDKSIKSNTKEHRFRAEAVIEMERFKSPKKDASNTGSRSSRPYSVQSTKSAPDVIVTH